MKSWIFELHCMLNVLLFDVILPSSQSSEIWNWAAELRSLGWIDWGFWFAFVVPKINTYTYMRKYTFVSVSWAIYVYVYIAPFNIYNCILTLRTIIRRYIYKNTNYFPVGPNVLGLGLYSGIGWMKFEKKGKGVAASLRFESPAVILIIRPQNFLSSHDVIINLNFPIHTRIIADWMSFSKSHNSIS